MIPEAVLVALVAGGSGTAVAWINSRSGKKVNERLDTIDKRLKKIEDYVVLELEDSEIIEKFNGLRTYYIENIDDKYKAIATIRSACFISLIHFLFGLDFKKPSEYIEYHSMAEGLFAEARLKMQTYLGKRYTHKYESKQLENYYRYMENIKAIFFDGMNAKKCRIVNVSLQYFQTFFDEFEHFDEYYGEQQTE